MTIAPTRGDVSRTVFAMNAIEINGALSELESQRNMMAARCVELAARLQSALARIKALEDTVASMPKPMAEDAK